MVSSWFGGTGAPNNAGPIDNGIDNNNNNNNNTSDHINNNYDNDNDNDGVYNRNRNEIHATIFPGSSTLAPTPSPPVNKRLSLKAVIAHLYPNRAPYKSEWDDHSRFSSLLLEHGEVPVDSWAVIIYSNPTNNNNNSNSTNHGNAKNAGLSSSATGMRSPVSSIQWEQAPLRAQLSKPNSSDYKQYAKSRGGNTDVNGVSVLDKDIYPSLHWHKCEGRLHLCTRSIVLEPTDTSASRKLLRCPFVRMDTPPCEYPSESTFESMSIEFVTDKHIVINPRSQSPFETIDWPGHFRVTFLHSSPTPFVNLCKQLWQITNSNKHQGSNISSTLSLDALLQPMWNRPFDPANLVDIREPMLTTHMPCKILRPLQSQPGVLVLTSQRLYVQPVAGVLSHAETRAWWYPLTDLVATARRYHGLRDSAIELYWKDQTSTLVALERRHDREVILRHLSSTLCVTDKSFVVEVAQAWYGKKLSNYEYLLALNAVAGRSFQDLSRYPVFPWVIADYESTKLDLTKPTTFRDLSKPVGALNPQRLEYFLKRLQNMPEVDQDRFLYGTHYSAPGYVLYYLVRSMPALMLCLQNGKFDAPDRLFHSIALCYKCALSNHADVKELIPEFYHPSEYDFLINARGLQLGATQNGDRVDDVELPPWARSPRDFLKKNRQALESAYVTQHLPMWLDLIFGFKSRGENALQANNLFHPITYLGPVQLANMTTAEERQQAELQAVEFGIVPDQLFMKPHLYRTEEAFDDSFVALDIGRASSIRDDTGREAWELLDPPSSLEDVQSTDEKSFGISKEDKVVMESEFPESSHVNISTDIVTPSRKIAKGLLSTDATNTIVSLTIGTALSYDGSVERPVFEQATSVWDMRVIERKRVHNDSVSSCVITYNPNDADKSMVTTTSLDGGLMVHYVLLGDTAGASESTSSQIGMAVFSSPFRLSSIMSRTQVLASASTTTNTTKLLEYRSHTARDPLASLVVAPDGIGGYVALAGGHDDVILAYGISSACAVASIYSHRDAVTGLNLIARPSKVNAASVLWSTDSTHVLVSGSWDATIKIWSVIVSSGEMVVISREPLVELFDTDSSIVCVSAITNPRGGIIVGAGCADGSFCVWDLHNDGVQIVLHKEPARRGSGPCSVIQWVSEGDVLHMFAGFSTGKVSSYILQENRLQRSSAVSVGVAVLSLVYSQGILLVGCTDGGLRLIPVRQGGLFDGKPTLWPEVNNKTSPGISSISIISIPPVMDSDIASKCVCCTGGSDGSIAIFELKKI